MPINAYWLTDPEAPYATFLRMVHAHCHPEADHRAYDELKNQAVALGDEMAVFKVELHRLLSGGLLDLPQEALDTAAEYTESNDLAFLQRLWCDLYPDEPCPQWTRTHGRD